MDRLMLAVYSIAVGMALTMGAWLCVSFWPFTVDDTFITLRYARNLANGYGLTWNPGEAAAEGYTSFAWTVLLAPIHFFTDDAQRSAKVMCLCAGVLSVAASAAFAADVIGAERPRIRALGVTFVLLWQLFQLGTTVHAVSGMDTSLFTTTIVALGWCGFCVLRNPSDRNFAAFAMCALLCGLTRPEGNVFSFVLALTTWLSLSSESRGSFGKTWMLIFVLPALGYFIGRVAYYGHLFPLPFYIKALGSADFLAGTGEAGEFLHELCIESPAFTLLALAGILGGPKVLRPLWWATLSVFIFFLKPVPLMAYNHRYLHPLIPLFAVAGAVGVGVVFDALRARVSVRANRAVLLALVAFACLGAATFSWRALPANLADKASYAHGLRRAHMALGRELALLPNPRAKRRIALLDVGAVGYYARDWSVLDTFGLTDPTLALEGREGRHATDYVLARAPTFIVFVSTEPDALQLVFPHEQPLLDAAQAAGYRQTSTREFVADYHLVVFEK